VPEPERIANTSLTIVGIEPPHRITLLDCARHLDAGIEDDRKAVAGI
jgi:hypothetical protein